MAGTITRLIKKTVQTALTTNKNEWITKSVVPDSIARHVETCFKMDIHGYKYVLETSYIRHIYKRHGEPSNDRIKIIQDDFSLLPAILTRPDFITKGSEKSRGNKTLRFKKTIDGETYYISICEVRNRKKSLAVDSLFKRKAPDKAGA